MQLKYNMVYPMSFKIKAVLGHPQRFFSGETLDDLECAVFNAMALQRGNRGWIYGIQNRQKAARKSRIGFNVLALLYCTFLYVFALYVDYVHILYEIIE